MFDFDFSEAIVKFSSFEFSQLGDALLFGGSMLAIGMLTVFAVLCVLWLFLAIFKFFLHDIPKKRAKNKKATPVVVTPEKIVEAKKDDDKEIIAVIAAAIAMAESDNSGMKFKVVSFRRV